MSNKEYVVKAYIKGNQIKVFQSNLQSEVMADVVEYLISEHDLIEQLGALPYISKHARYRVVLNDEPTHTDGSPMKQYKKIRDRYYLHTHLQKHSKKVQLRELAYKCNIDLDFNGDW